MRKVVVLGVVLVLAAAVACYRLYVAPGTDEIWTGTPADAVLALGGMEVTGVFARRLQLQGRARTLVLSNPYYRGVGPGDVMALCDQAAARTDPAILCFRPDPVTTRGEAEELGRLAAERGWRRVIVVAPRFHISRARMIVRRCYSGQLAMVAPDIAVPVRTWLYQFAYQTGGFAKTLVQRDC